MKDDWRWRLKDWSCAVGRGEGGAGPTGVYPQLLLLSENSTVGPLSGICMRTTKQVSSPLKHVTRAPGETPGVDVWGENPPRGSLAFTEEMLMKA